MAYVTKGQQTMVAAALRQAFLRPDQDGACQVRRGMADQFRPRRHKPAKLLDGSGHDVLAYMGFSVQHRVKLHSVNRMERLNGEVKRRADVVSIFHPEPSILRLIGAVLLEVTDEWLLQHRLDLIEGGDPSQRLGGDRRRPGLAEIVKAPPDMAPAEGQLHLATLGQHPCTRRGRPPAARRKKSARCATGRSALRSGAST